MSTSPKPPPSISSTEVLVVGSGIAGLTFALQAAEWGRVRILTKKRRADSATNYARGGIAATWAPEDTPELHVADTLASGDGLCNREVVEGVVREGPARVRELIDWGVRFHREGASFSLGKEGGHSRRRILHVGDRTGREIERALLEAGASHPRIQVEENLLVAELLLAADPSHPLGTRCVGVHALDHGTGRWMEVTARAVLLATGGVGQVFLHTTNPPIATGDGVAMAYRAGASVGNLEFIQFHPTALHPTEDPAFLLSEAIRGEGAILRRPDGSSFMEGYHPDRSLAPRDVVARAIQQELRLTGADHMVLDVTPVPREVMETRFPGAVEGCRKRGVRLFESGIPVVPAAHYLCGGVLSDAEGRSDLPGLYVVGEVACTGMHGANRLASNSLLEAVVFSRRAAEAVREELEGGSNGGARAGMGRPPNESLTPGREGAGRSTEIPGKEDGSREDRSREERMAASLSTIRHRLRTLMWEEVGIVRTDEGLRSAEVGVRSLEATFRELGPHAGGSVEGIELRNLLTTAGLIIRSARWRQESRGLHHTLDHPLRDDRHFRRDSRLRAGEVIEEVRIPPPTA